MVVLNYKKIKKVETCFFFKYKNFKLIYFFEFINRYKKSMFSDSLKNKISFHLIHKLFKNTINKQKETKNKNKKETKNKKH
jgi:hypothetical protein